MAGSFGFKLNPKNKNINKRNNNEILKDISDASPKINTPKLSGTLFPGQSIDINRSPQEPKVNWSQEFITKSLTQEQSLFVNQHTQEIQKSIQNIRLEINKLVQSTQNLDNEVQQAVSKNIPEFNDYQIGFLQRLKNLIIQFRQNIDQSSVWLASLNHKKSRKNAFWGSVKNKKSGGEQYLLSSEHSVSRSAN
ncbi:MAG: DUF5660 domain-containing protein [Candidatus Shapirobacteria bacterium]|nr:DUF5660 domain-containing protein [Candidatus Shapirobacteria bacterium]